MAATTLTITIEQGATYSKLITWKTGTPALPIDLTGCTARMQVRAKITSVTPLLELTTENGGIILGGTAGTITLFISAEDTAAFDWDGGAYDLEIEFTDGTVVRRLYGSVSVSPEVTRV